MNRAEGRAEFRLEVFPNGEDSYGVTLLQSRDPNRGLRRTDWERVDRLWGMRLRAVLDHVLFAVKRAGYRPTDLNRSRTKPFRLKEEDAVRLGLLMVAIKPLRRLDRIEAIAERMRTMEPEEAYYWFSKSMSQDFRRRARRAFRILHAEG